MNLPKELTTVTSLSKTIALIMFITLPIIAFLFGMKYENMLIEINNSSNQLLQQNALKISKPTQILTQIPTPSVSVINSSTDSAQMKDWKTYINDKFVKYKVSYPDSWILNPVLYSDSITLQFKSNDNQFISLRCPGINGGKNGELPNPYKWEPNEGSFKVQYYKKLTINNMSAVQYVWSPSDKNGELLTSILRPVNPVVCEFVTNISVNNGTLEETVNLQKIYNDIINTFQYLD